jgi:hypothetical protein
MRKKISQIVFIGKVKDVLNDNIDVEVELDDGTKYTATFFTLLNVHYLMQKHKHITSENNSGTFFWASDMGIVESLDHNCIRVVRLHHIQEYPRCA